MSMSIGPGDWVEAVRSFTGEYSKVHLIKGMPYLVQSLIPSEGQCIFCHERPDTAIRIFEAQQHAKCGMCPCNFRLLPPPEALVRTTETQIPLRTPLRCEPA